MFLVYIQTSLILCERTRLEDDWTCDSVNLIFWEICSHKEIGLMETGLTRFDHLLYYQPLTFSKTAFLLNPTVPSAKHSYFPASSWTMLRMTSLFPWNEYLGPDWRSSPSLIHRYWGMKSSVTHSNKLFIPTNVSISTLLGNSWVWAGTHVHSGSSVVVWLFNGCWVVSQWFLRGYLAVVKWFFSR